MKQQYSLCVEVLLTKEVEYPGLRDDEWARHGLPAPFDFKKLERNDSFS